MPTREEKIAEVERLQKIEQIKTLQAKASLPETPALQSGLMGAVDAGSLGFADEAAGLLKAGRQTLVGDKKFKDFKDTYKSERDMVRASFEKAKADNPTAYTVGEVGGSIGTAFIPGLGVAKGATAAKSALNAARYGAVAGLGTSSADLTEGDIANAAEDVGAGALTGATTDLAFRGAGKALKAATPKNAAKKLANVVLNTPEEITDLYITNKKGVLEAPRRFELAREYEDVLENLKKQVISGSKESRETLSKEGLKITKGEVQEIAKKLGDDLEKSFEGVYDDPQKVAALKYLRKFQEDWKATPAKAADIAFGPPRSEVSANRLKDTLQSIDRSTDFETAPGQFSRIDDNVKKELRANIDELLKGRSPAYKEQMKAVASDAELLNRGSEVAKSPQALSNVLRRVETDQYGAGQIPAETIRDVDARMGSSILERAKLSNAKEQFDKSVTNGSMNVNKFSNMVRDVPVLKYAGPLIGASVDKYGRKITMQAVDAAEAIERNWKQNPSVQSIKQQLKPITEFAKKGDPTAIVTFQILQEKNPELIKLLEQKEPNKFERRLNQGGR
jgi:hypothetical protein